MMLRNAILLAVYLGGAIAAPLTKLGKRVDASEVLPSYDFIVIGGGTSGLVVANRLTENPSVTVLVIEAGDLESNDGITIPRKGGAAMYTKNDWQFKTAPQPHLNNRVIDIPAGKIVGGSSGLNGLMFDRGAAGDYDAWEELGNPGWGWNGLLPYFKKSETFTPPPPAVAAEYGITWDPAAHGNNGPIHSSFPITMNEIDKVWFAAFNHLGIPTQLDGGNGEAYNVFWSPNTIHPVNASRSWARTGYYDPIVNTRPNFHLLSEHHVTKILLKKKLLGVEAEGVEYAASNTSPRKTVKASKEVILAAGTITSPKLLQLSGIGRSSLLSQLNITKFVDLPGVGTNYQDHSFQFVGTGASSIFDVLPVLDGTPEDAAARAEYIASRTGPYTSGGPNGLAFLPLSEFADATTILNAYKAQSVGQYLRTGTAPSVVLGYEVQKRILAKMLAKPTIAAQEFMWFWGHPVSALQHTFSRGYVEIVSADPFEYPVLDPRYLSNPLDLEIITKSFDVVEDILTSPPVLAAYPERALQMPVDRVEYTRQTFTTSFHSSSTCPMQPRILGGVVDPTLRVYGTRNLRIVDASIMPLIPGTHLQSTVYAVAEKAADIIKGKWNL